MLLPILQRGDNANVSVVMIRSAEQLIFCFKEKIDGLWDYCMHAPIGKL